MTFVIWMIGQVILIAMVVPLVVRQFDNALYERYSDAALTRNQEALGALLNEMIGLNPLTLALFLLTFPVALTGLYFGQKLIHRRTLTSLHTAFKRFDFGRALQGVLVIWGVLAVGTLIAKTLGAPVNYIFDSKRFWGFMIVSLLFIPLQSATEEIVFRGYFNQALGRFIKNKWVVFTLTSLGFMALHLSNPEALDGAENGVLPIVMSGYFIFGFACCILVLIDDGLESAIGIHAGNNTFAAIFVNYEGSVLPTPAIWETVPDPTKDAITTIIVLAIAVAILYYIKPKVQRDRAVLKEPSTPIIFN